MESRYSTTYDPSKLGTCSDGTPVEVPWVAVGDAWAVLSLNEAAVRAAAHTVDGKVLGHSIVAPPMTALNATGLFCR
jgi:hypothetical protein